MGEFCTGGRDPAPHLATGDAAEEPTALVPQPRRAVAPTEQDPDPRRILHADDPKTILRRLTNGDPLGLYERCARRTRERHLLVEVDRLFELALAIVATAAVVDSDESVGTSEWMNSQIDRALESILCEDQEAERRAVDSGDPDNPSYAFVRDVFGVEGPIARGATVAFNGLPHRVRAVFFALVVKAKSVDQCVAEGLGTVAALKRDVQLAFRTLGHLDESDEHDSLGEEPK
jgi:hypothetical protein